MPSGVETNGRCTLIQALEVRLRGFFFLLLSSIIRRVV
jgi:hypothetical protein